MIEQSDLHLEKLVFTYRDEGGALMIMPATIVGWTINHLGVISVDIRPITIDRPRQVEAWYLYTSLEECWKDRFSKYLGETK